MSNLKLVYRSNFSLNRGELDEWYELWRLRKGLFGREKWKPVYMHYGEMSTIPHRGDRDWANRVAAHYGIEVPQNPPNEKGN